MNTTQTQTAANNERASLDEMLQAFDEALDMPIPIGTMCGAVVYLNRKQRTLSWIGVYGISIDHPYIKDTAIYTAAMKYL